MCSMARDQRIRAGEVILGSALVAMKVRGGQLQLWLVSLT